MLEKEWIQSAINSYLEYSNTLIEALHVLKKTEPDSASVVKQEIEHAGAMIEGLEEILYRLSLIDSES